MKILCLGDSLTQGYGVNYGLGWVELLNKDGTNMELYNEGLNGDTLEGMRLRLGHKKDLKIYKAVTLMGGTNDILMGANFESCYQKYKRICDEIIEKGSKPIIMAPMEVVYDYGNINKQIKKYHDVLLELSEEKECIFIDFHSLFEEAKNRCENVMDGDVHPNEKGYYLMAELVKSKLSSLV